MHRTDEGRFVTGIIRDITQRKQRQKELESTRALLAAENWRKSEELEKARQLQLAMLPSDVPQLPHLEIDAYMKTATEVGGDYYDFQFIPPRSSLLDNSAIHPPAHCAFSAISILYAC